MSTIGVWLLPTLLLFASPIQDVVGFGTTCSLTSSTVIPNRRCPQLLVAAINNDACIDIGDEKPVHRNSRARKRARRRASVRDMPCGRGRDEVDKHYQGTLSRRLAAAIWACGSDWKRAYDLLYDAYPHLRGSALSTMIESDDMSSPVCQLEDFRIDGKSISSAIEVMGRARRLAEVLKLLDYVAILSKVCKREEDKDRKCATSIQFETDVRLCYRAAISAAGMCGKWRVALKLMQDMPARVGLFPKADLYHVAVSACGRCGAVDAALLLVAEMESGRSVLSKRTWNRRDALAPPKADRMAYQTAITACMRNKRCDEAGRLLLRMKQSGLAPDISQYNQVLSAYAKAGGRHKDAVRLLDEIEKESNLAPNMSTYNLVISACGKDCAWKQASAIMNRMEGMGYQAKATHDVSKQNDVSTKVAAVSEGRMKSHNSSAYFSDLDVLPKHKYTGKDTCWEIARYSCQARRGRNGVQPSAEYSNDFVEEIIVGVQPHRNPVRNGVSLIFLDGRSKSKMGFMLLRHTAEKDERAESAVLFSSLIGMLVDEKHRGKGLSNIFAAIWLQLCMDVGAFPRAEMIKKPLISVVLDRFGFIPQSGGVAVEVSPISSVRHVMNESEVCGANLVLYNPMLAIEGIYGKRELRVQKMIVSPHPPKPRGKLVHVKTGFHHPVFIRRGKDGPHSTIRDQTKVGLAEESKPSTRSSTNVVCHKNLKDLRRHISKALSGHDGSGDLSSGGDTDLLKRATFGFIINVNASLPIIK